MAYISADIKYMPKGIYNYGFLLIIVCEVTSLLLALPAKVMHYILDVLKVNVKLVLPHNHGSLKTERYIQTINKLITRQLTGKGTE